MSKIADATLIGISSSVISLATIFATFASLGIPLGIQRFLGKNFYEQQFDAAAKFIKTSMILTSLSIFLCSVSVFLLRTWLYNTFQFDILLIAVSILLLSSTAFMTLFRSFVISTLDTKMLPMIMICGAVLKIIFAAILVYFDFGAVGITLGYAFFPILGTVIYALIVARIIKPSKSHLRLGEYKYHKDIMVSGLVNWIPTIIYTLGSHLGTLLVFGSHGPLQAGVYFIAFSLSLAVTALMSALFTIAYPTLSSMQDGRKRFTWRTVKISLIFSIPLSILIISYSKEALSIFGYDYSAGSITLQILLLSIFPIALTTGLTNLSYALGGYRDVLLMGLAANVPRAILYFGLVPYFEGEGAAISYTVGSFIGFLSSLIIYRKLNLKFNWIKMLLIFMIPFILVTVFSVLHLYFIVSAGLTLLVTYFAYVFLRVLDKKDIDDIISILPSGISKKLTWITHILEEKNK